MSLQILDVFEYRKLEWHICGATPRVPWTPWDSGISVYGPSTGEKRGYFCEYLIVNNQLFLCQAMMCVEESLYKATGTDKGVRLFGTPASFVSTTDLLFGILPRQVKDDSYIRCTAMMEPIPFTGGVLLGRDPVRGWMFIPAGYCFRETWEVVFEDGKVVHERNVSEGMEALRRWFTERPKAESDNYDNFRMDGQQEYDKLFYLSYKFW